MDIEENNLTENKEEEAVEEVTENTAEVMTDEITDKENTTENAELTEKKEEEKKPILSFTYDVKNKEEEEAFILFQKKFVYKHNWKITAAFAVLAILFGISVIKNPNGYLNYILCFICVFIIALTWINTRRIRKYLMQALKPLEDDKYEFSLYYDSFKIETIVSDEEKKSEDFEPIPARIVNFDDITLNVIENEDMFIIILKKETIYVLSKRVISGEKQKILREQFSRMLDKDFEIINNN